MSPEERAALRKNSVTFSLNHDDTIEEIMELVTAALNEIGITVVVDPGCDARNDGSLDYEFVRTP